MPSGLTRSLRSNRRMAAVRQQMAWKFIVGCVFRACRFLNLLEHTEKRLDRGKGTGDVREHVEGDNRTHRIRSGLRPYPV